MAQLFKTSRSENFGGRLDNFQGKVTMFGVDGAKLEKNVTFVENERWAAKVALTFGALQVGDTVTCGNATVQLMSIDRENKTACFDTIAGFSGKRANSQFTMAWGGSSVSGSSVPSNNAPMAATSEVYNNVPRDGNIDDDDATDNNTSGDGDNNDNRDNNEYVSFADNEKVNQAREDLKAAEDGLNSAKEYEAEAWKQYDEAKDKTSEARNKKAEAEEKVSQCEEGLSEANKKFEEDPTNEDYELNQMEAEANLNAAKVADKRAQKEVEKAEAEENEKRAEADEATNGVYDAMADVDRAKDELDKAIDEAMQQSFEQSQNEENGNNEEGSNSEENGNNEAEAEEGDNERAEESKQSVKPESYDKVMSYVKRGFNVMLIGPAGTGKTYITQQIAKNLGKPYFSIGTTYDVAEVKGYKDANGRYIPSVVYNACKMAATNPNGAVLVIDEADSWGSDTLLAMNEIFANYSYTFPNGETLNFPKLLAFCCTNTIGHGQSEAYAGRAKMDVATLNRFAKVIVPYSKTLDMLKANNDTDLIEVAQAVRNYATETGLPYVMTPRDLERIKAVESDLSMCDCLEGTFADWTKEDISQLLGRISASNRWFNALNEVKEILLA